MVVVNKTKDSFVVFVKGKFDAPFIPSASSTFLSADPDDGALDVNLRQMQLNVSVGPDVVLISA